MSLASRTQAHDASISSYGDSFLTSLRFSTWHLSDHLLRARLSLLGIRPSKELLFEDCCCHLMPPLLLTTLFERVSLLQGPAAARETLLLSAGCAEARDGRTTRRDTSSRSSSSRLFSSRIFFRHSNALTLSSPCPPHLDQLMCHPFPLWASPP